MTKKTSVKRITSQEERVVEVLRKHSTFQVYSDLKNALGRTALSDNTESLNDLMNALLEHSIRPVKEMLKEGYIDEPTLEVFLKAVEDKKSIIITGAKGSGKSSFLRSMVKLLSSKKALNIGLLDSRRDIVLSSLIDGKHVHDISVDGLKAVDLMSSLASDKVELGVLSEVSTIADIFVITSSIMNGTPVLMSINYEVDSKDNASDKVVSYLEDKVKTLKSNGVFRLMPSDVVVFQCSAEDSKFKVSSLVSTESDNEEVVVV